MKIFGINSLLVMAAGVPTGAIIGIIAAVVLIIIMAACYKKAPPTEALVITGVGHREPKVISGKGAVVIPVLQRVDHLLMRIMKVDVKTPQTGVKTLEGVPLWLDAVVTIQVYANSSTVSAKEIEQAGCKTRKEFITMRQQAAISNFLGYNEEAISNKVNDVLQGNLREIVATMTVIDVLTKRKEFAESVIENARPDLAKMGLEVVTFNIQDIQDALDNCGERHGVVEAIGVQREMEVKRDAEQARATAMRDIEVAKANAERETAEQRAQAEKLTAEANTSLALRKAELKAQADKAAADAAAAGRIQEQLQEKIRKQAEADVAIAAQEKEILRAEKEAEVRQRKLDAEVRKKADADKYQAEKLADAQKYAAEQRAAAQKVQRQLEAEARLIEVEKEAEAKKVAAEAALVEATKRAEAELVEATKKAEGIRAVGEAEATATRAKALAEAEGIDKKAEAMKKYGEAAVIEMVMNALPEIAKNVAEPLSKVNKITMYGEGNSAKLVNDIVNSTNQITNGITEGMGIDLKSLLYGMLGGKLAASGANPAPAVNIDPEKDGAESDAE
ncbi:MAG: flotillin family protein [Clostridia bacterium]|nr:flotillin family protein [Clostridia bacterium]